MELSVFILRMSYKKRWTVALKKGSGNDYELLQSVIKDSNECKKVLSSGKYYSCAKFVRDTFGKFFTKEDHYIQTCCRAYPNICGGVCCCEKLSIDDDECKCNILPKKMKNIGLCYNDSCRFVEYKSKKFYIKWHHTYVPPKKYHENVHK